MSYSDRYKPTEIFNQHVHFSEISVLQQEGMPTILDITSSPLNSGVNTNGINQDNTLRIPESVIMERNYTQLSITGTEKERKLKVAYFNVDGKLIYSTEFAAVRCRHILLPSEFHPPKRIRQGCFRLGY